MHENQLVKAGDPLFRLDKSDFENGRRRGAGATCDRRAAGLGPARRLRTKLRQTFARRRRARSLPTVSWSAKKNLFRRGHRLRSRSSTRRRTTPTSLRVTRPRPCRRVKRRSPISAARPTSQPTSIRSCCRQKAAAIRPPTILTTPRSARRQTASSPAWTRFRSVLMFNPRRRCSGWSPASPGSMRRSRKAS